MSEEDIIDVKDLDLVDPDSALTPSEGVVKKPDDNKPINFDRSKGEIPEEN
ncbi:13011_t:CDS:1, partial [Cetraspora pellucida]